MEGKGNHLYGTFSHWGNSIFAIGDTHFGDEQAYRFRFPCEFKGIRKGSPEAREVVRKLDMQQVRAINRVCGRDSTLIHLGDVGDTAYVGMLRAKRKVLIMGNHDSGASNYMRNRCQANDSAARIADARERLADVSARIDSIIDAFRAEMETVLDRKPLKHDERSIMEGHKTLLGSTLVDVWNSLVKQEIDIKSEIARLGNLQDNHLFDEVYDGPLMVNGKVLLSHEPVNPLPPYMLNLHGHIHNTKAVCDANHMNLCAEAVGYVPFNLVRFIRDGGTAGIEDIHRGTIDNATRRKSHRERNPGKAPGI